MQPDDVFDYLAIWKATMLFYYVKVWGKRDRMMNLKFAEHNILSLRKLNYTRNLKV